MDDDVDVDAWGGGGGFYPPSPRARGGQSASQYCHYVSLTVMASGHRAPFQTDAAELASARTHHIPAAAGSSAFYTGSSQVDAG